MSSFPSPARPRVGGWPSVVGGLSPHRVGSVAIRIALVSPPTGRLAIPDANLEWASAAITGDPPHATHLAWRVRGYHQARAPGHEHFWFEGDTPYRDVSQVLPLGVNFVLPGGEADDGYSTWRVTVTALSDKIELSEEEASFAVFKGMYLVPGYIIDDLVVPVELSEIGSAGEGVSSTIESVPVTEPVVVETIRDVNPAYILDPWQVG